MKRKSVRSRILVLAGLLLLGLFVFSGFVLFEIVRSTPSEETVQREFLVRYPRATIRDLELIFEQDGSVVYLVTAREDDASAEGKYDFALRRLNGIWTWCDDQTNNPCGPIAK